MPAYDRPGQQITSVLEKSAGTLCGETDSYPRTVLSEKRSRCQQTGE